MWYALVQDIPASWERYDAVARSLDPRPSGLILHLAGPTDEGFRIIEIWESESAWRLHAVDLEAAIAAVDPDVPVRVTVRTLRSMHVDVAATWRVMPGEVPGS